MLDISYILMCEGGLTPEEKLAKAVIMDWFATLIRLLAKSRLTGEEKMIWRRELAWPYTENARFWVEDVLGGSVVALRCLASDIEKFKEGGTPDYFPVLFEVMRKRKKIIRHRRSSRKGRVMRAAVQV